MGINSQRKVGKNNFKINLFDLVGTPDSVCWLLKDASHTSDKINDVKKGPDCSLSQEGVHFKLNTLLEGLRLHICLST